MTDGEKGLLVLEIVFLFLLPFFEFSFCLLPFSFFFLFHFNMELSCNQINKDGGARVVRDYAKFRVFDGFEHIIVRTKHTLKKFYMPI